MFQRDYNTFFVSGSLAWTFFKLRIDQPKQAALLTVLHNSEEGPVEEIELSPNIGKFTYLRLTPRKPGDGDGFKYNFLGFTAEGKSI